MKFQGSHIAENQSRSRTWLAVTRRKLLKKGCLKIASSYAYEMADN